MSPGRCTLPPARVMWGCSGTERGRPRSESAPTPPFRRLESVEHAWARGQARELDVGVVDDVAAIVGEE
jgi:hypothetical protein